MLHVRHALKYIFMMYSDKPRREIYRFKFSRADTTVDLPFINNIGHEQKVIIAKLSLLCRLLFSSDVFQLSASKTSEVYP